MINGGYGRKMVVKELFGKVNEPATVDAMHRFMEEQGYVLDITDKRLHHEIYLSDARKAQPEKLKTVIRHPIRALDVRGCSRSGGSRFSNDRSGT